MKLATAILGHGEMITAKRKATRSFSLDYGFAIKHLRRSQYPLQYNLNPQKIANKP
jgi:hypothetical protein